MLSKYEHVRYKGACNFQVKYVVVPVHGGDNNNSERGNRHAGLFRNSNVSGVVRL